MFGDVGEHMLQVVSASALALWYVLGFPNDEITPNPLSMEKLNCKYTHQRKTLGHSFDTRAMVVTILPEKRDMMLTILQDWILNITDFTLRDISSLHSSLESMTRYILWARPMFFGVQNAIRQELRIRYHVFAQV